MSDRALEVSRAMGVLQGLIAVERSDGRRWVAEALEGVLGLIDREFLGDAALPGPPGPVFVSKVPVSPVMTATSRPATKAPEQVDSPAPVVEVASKPRAPTLAEKYAGSPIIPSKKPEKKVRAMPPLGAAMALEDQRVAIRTHLISELGMPGDEARLVDLFEEPRDREIAVTLVKRSEKFEYVSNGRRVPALVRRVV